ncbi:VOC family protein [Paenibacillus sp. KQZ6P-2]|uniref:VOC family protein n=1 Tax=Paenibacillus mangrovi TaxID=2931978 RepID=A0A9X1WN59_9BACL|nr:VOC family protein [Paenibacillus mangrovi]MCJ8012312.1 VOC family protein [Paenibacillus mangrovi]
MNEQSQKSGLESFNWSGFHHVALVTSDLDGTINFYEKVLGMQVTSLYPATPQRGRHCFVKPGNTKSWGIHFFEYPDAQIFQSADSLRRLSVKPESLDLYRFLPGGLQHIAFALTSEQDGMTLRKKLNAHEVVMTDIYDQGSLRNFIFIDNNGIQLEAAWPKERNH